MVSFSRKKNGGTKRKRRIFQKQKNDSERLIHMTEFSSPITVSAVLNGKDISGDALTKLGINITVDADGKIFITSPETEVSFVKLTFPRTFSKDALIYGDAFERGYGDLRWEKDRRDVLRWYMIATDNGEHLGCGVKTLPNALCSWLVSDDSIQLICDIRCGTDAICHSEPLFVAQTVFVNGNGCLHTFCRDFCTKMCDKPSVCDRPVFGANDWYCNYGESSEEKILRAAKFTVRCADGLPCKPFMVVDDGWEVNRHDGFIGGEWNDSNENFGCMKELAAKISAIGAIPGIWFRPLQSKKDLPDECFTDKSDFRLDPSHPKVLETVAEDIRRFYDWGFRLVKYDFVTDDIFRLWGKDMPEDYFIGSHPLFDKTKTTAQIIKNFYKTIRDNAPADMVLLSCNAIGHLVTGYANIQRTGDDTSGRDWDRTREMGVNTLAFRMMQHMTFFEADADCVGITAEVPLEMNKRWLDVLSKSSTPLFFSIAEDCETEEVAALVTEAFGNAIRYRSASVPTDWLGTLTPCEWDSDAGHDTYSWNM